MPHATLYVCAWPPVGLWYVMVAARDFFSRTICWYFWICEEDKQGPCPQGACNDLGATCSTTIVTTTYPLTQKFHFGVHTLERVFTNHMRVYAENAICTSSLGWTVFSQPEAIVSGAASGWSQVHLPGRLKGSIYQNTHYPVGKLCPRETLPYGHKEPRTRVAIKSSLIIAQNRNNPSPSAGKEIKKLDNLCNRSPYNNIL